MHINLRKANESDIPAVISLIKELALYEKAPQEVTITEEDLKKDGFGNNPVFEIILAENKNEIVGMAFFYISYSTWKGKCIYLEDIIVKQAFRGNKIGKQLFESVIVKAKEIGAKRMQWQVLEWNTPAINFYKKYNAGLDQTWVNGRLTEQQIKQFNPLKD
ncbi:MAG TPA: GNAT family N-acetyltransferase [Bacteroidales bacterium]|mgnify:FL=1|nr:GNAT family N-acetyltransferase [Bacteroidales bacterium]HQI44939.1 GNAT family N-acetyltransferase [Bacteroidales bacterium]